MYCSANNSPVGVTTNRIICYSNFDIINILQIIISIPSSTPWWKWFHSASLCSSSADRRWLTAVVTNTTDCQNQFCPTGVATFNCWCWCTLQSLLSRINTEPRFVTTPATPELASTPTHLSPVTDQLLITIRLTGVCAGCEVKEWRVLTISISGPSYLLASRTVLTAETLPGSISVTCNV